MRWPSTSRTSMTLSCTGTRSPRPPRGRAARGRSRHRLVGAGVGQLDPRALGELLERRAGVEHLAVRVDGLARHDVALVPDLADQLLDEVLERDDAVGAAVLVDDDGDVRPLVPQRRQRGQQPVRPRQRDDRPRHVATVAASPPDASCRSRTWTKAEHVVEVAADDRVSASAAGPRPRRRPPRARGRRRGRRPRARRRHHLGHRVLRGAEDLGEHRAPSAGIASVEVTRCCSSSSEISSPEALGSSPSRPYDAVGRDRQQRMTGRISAANRSTAGATSSATGRALRGDALRHELAEHERDVRDGHRQPDERDRRSRTLRAGPSPRARA